ncbi:MAG: hypothetical protein M3063_05510 [Actinomycetota bacterium]|nr:hypothetical protein [Actinomycetota bacterium]
MHPLLTYPSETLSISAWPDDVIDRIGFDPRSAYVEQFWLAILGPSTTWLLRRLAAAFDEQPGGFELPLAETARALGLGDRGGRHSPFLRSVNRLVLFELAQPTAPDQLAVRRTLPPLNRRQLTRLDPERQAAHDAWQARQLTEPSGEQQRRRSRHLALSLVELGEGREDAERQLLRWRYHPEVAQEAAMWAWERHLTALEAARAG